MATTRAHHLTPAETEADHPTDWQRSAAAVRSAVRTALIEHKRRGEAVVVREDGRIRWVAPEDIIVPDEPS